MKLSRSRVSGEMGASDCYAFSSRMNSATPVELPAELAVRPHRQPPLASLSGTEWTRSMPTRPASCMSPVNRIRPATTTAYSAR